MGRIETDTVTKKRMNLCRQNTGKPTMQTLCWLTSSFGCLIANFALCIDLAGGQNFSERHDEIILKEKVDAADLIIVGQVKLSTGSRKAQTFLFKEPQVIRGTIASGKEVAAVVIPTSLTARAKPDTRWIVFLSKPLSAENESFENRPLIGNGWDTNGMVIASEENLAAVKKLIGNTK